MKVTGFSHVTIKVRDLPASLRFYVDLLGMRLVHRGEHDVYLEWGAAWLCLQERERGHGAPPPQEPEWGVDHVAFHIDQADFDAAVDALRQAGVTIVRGPVQRGLGWSVNFLDPDGAQLELHTSTLAERMTVWS